MSDRRIILPAKVKDNVDPLMLGRLRLEPQTKYENFSVPTDSNGQPIPEVDYAWTYQDPFVFLPLLPYYISQIPEIGEYVHIIYSTREEPLSKNKFYVQGPVSRPWNNKREVYKNSISMLSDGEYIQQPFAVRDKNNGVIQEVVKDVYPLPGDNAFLGRGNSDVVLKKSDVLLRAGKYIPNPTVPESGVGQVQFPDIIPYEKRAFLQLSLFDQEKVDTGTEDLETEEYIDLNVKNFVEWNITNIDLNTNTADGNVRTYTVKENEDTTVLNFSIDDATLLNCTPIAGSKLDFTGYTSNQIVEFIVNYIRGFNRGVVNISGYKKYPNNGNLISQFPFAFGPGKSTNDTMLDTSLGVNPVIQNFITNIFNQIKLYESNQESGFAVVWDKDIVGPQSNTLTTTITKSEYKNNAVTYATMGGDILYFLTHKTNNTDYSIDLKDTLYGIKQEKFTDYLKGRTNSMVRGEELMKLLNQIYLFIEGHVHVGPCDIPDIATDSGITLASIKTLIDNAEKNILNQNIRIN
jgi:hypothetical protein